MVSDAEHTVERPGSEATHPFYLFHTPVFVVQLADCGDGDLRTHPDSGAIGFLSPVSGAGTAGGLSLFPTTFTVRPRSSMLVSFPGWLQHYVHPYRGTQPRVGISCNVRMDIAPPRTATTEMEQPHEDSQAY